MSRMFWLFRRGHHTYTSLVLSLLNFFTLQYHLFFSDSPYVLFIAVFLYVPVAVALGYFDQKKNLRVDSTLLSRESPYQQDIARALILLAENRNNEVREVLKKWL